MKRLAVRVPAQLWASIEWYGRQAGLVDAAGRVDISETLRDLIARGLNSDRSAEAGYRNGYAEGRSAGYRDFMRRVATVSTATVTRGGNRP